MQQTRRETVAAALFFITWRYKWVMLYRNCADIIQTVVCMVVKDIRTLHSQNSTNVLCQHFGGRSTLYLNNGFSSNTLRPMVMLLLWCLHFAYTLVLRLSRNNEGLFSSYPQKAAKESESLTFFFLFLGTIADSLQCNATEWENRDEKNRGMHPLSE